MVYLARATLIFALVVIALGAYTRLVDAGLGCPDWPGCYGHWLLPLSEEAVSQANAQWQDSPVDIFRAAVEMTHRVAAGMLGVLVLVLAFLSWRARHAFLLACVVTGLIVAQGLFGMWTVTLKLLPQIVTMHLLGGFGVLCALYCYYLRSLYPSSLTPNQPRFTMFKTFAWLAWFLIFAQIALGGWLSANYAAVACPDFPMCQGQWVPPMDFGSAFNMTRDAGPNYLGGLLDNTARVTIHLSHRLGAVLLSLYLIIFGIYAVRAHIHNAARLAIYGMWVVLIAQLCLGVSNIIFHFPIALAVAHNLCGALLMLSITRVLYFLYYDSKPCA